MNFKWIFGKDFCNFSSKWDPGQSEGWEGSSVSCCPVADPRLAGSPGVRPLPCPSCCASLAYRDERCTHPCQSLLSKFLSPSYIDPCVPARLSVGSAFMLTTCDFAYLSVCLEIWIHPHPWLGIMCSLAWCVVILFGQL